MAIRIYTSKHCGPCQQVADIIKNGNLDVEVELIDIETDEGFKKFSEEVLEKGDGAVPSAYKDGVKCAILIDQDNNISLDCPDDPPASPED